jgi:hypothetical protein
MGQHRACPAPETAATSARSATCCTAARCLYCNAEGCGHHRKMDLVDLVAAHGEDMPLQRLVDRAICSRCGQRSVSVTVPPDLGERGGFSYRPYAG